MLVLKRMYHKSISLRATLHRETVTRRKEAYTFVFTLDVSMPHSKQAEDLTRTCTLLLIVRIHGYSGERINCPGVAPSLCSKASGRAVHRRFRCLSSRCFFGPTQHVCTAGRHLPTWTMATSTTTWVIYGTVRLSVRRCILQKRFRDSRDEVHGQDPKSIRKPRTHPSSASLATWKDTSAQESGEDSKILEECSGVAVGHQSESTQGLDDGFHCECSDELNLTTSATFKTGVCNFFFPLHPRRCVHLQSFQWRRVGSGHAALCWRASGVDAR